jgi:hypothetical protein
MKLNTTQKTRHYIFLVVLLIFSLTTLSCGLLGGGDKEEESKATQLPAAEATKAAAEKATPAEEQPTKPPAGEKTKPPAGPSGATGLFANPEESLDSYRMRTKMTLVEGEGMLGEEMITEIEWVRDPEARQTTMYGASGEVMMEIIIIGDDSWTSMDGENWMHVKKTETDEEAPFSPEDFQTSLEDLMKDMESSLKKAGKDTVDGVRCQEYTVDADFSLPFPTPENASEQMLQFIPQEIKGHIEGKICVADERGLPEVIVRSVTTQEMTLKYASGKEETMVYDEDREMYDINESITIKPPEGQVQEMPSMPTPPPSGEQTTPSAEQPGESVEYASLDTLDSYRLEWSVTIKTGDTEVKSSYEMEWTKEPPAWHMVMSMGEGGPQVEYIWVDNTFWIKAGDTWVESGEAEAEDTLHQAWDITAPSDDMILTGEETVNGVHCNHYVKDIGAPYSVHEEVWVANQSDLPPVVIRGLNRMEMSGMVTTIEANVYDINTPITIEAPK